MDIFHCNVDIANNKVYVWSDVEIDIPLTVSIYNETSLKYRDITVFHDKTYYWYMPDKPLKGYKSIIVKVSDGDIDLFTYNYESVGVNILVGCLGDVLSSTPVVRMISKAYKSPVIVFTDYMGIFINNPYVKEVKHGPPSDNDIKNINIFTIGRSKVGDYAKNIRKMNTVDYFSMDIGITLNPYEKSIDFFPDDFDKDKFNLPNDYICVNPSITYPSKTWSKDNWNYILSKLDYNIVVLGKDVSYGLDRKYVTDVIHKDNIINLSNKTTLSEAWHILNKSRLFLTMDGGLLHLAGSTDVEIVQIGSSVNPYDVVPFRNGSQDYKYTFIGGECKLFCATNLSYNTEFGLKNFPYSHSCLEKYSEFRCHPSADKVLNVIKDKLSKVHSS